MSKIKTFIKSCIGFHCQVPFVYLNFFKCGVTSHAVHIGGVKVTNNVICKWKCHFGATYMDGMTFIFDFKRDLMMIAYAKCHICYFKVTYFILQFLKWKMLNKTDFFSRDTPKIGKICPYFLFKVLFHAITYLNMFDNFKVN